MPYVLTIFALAVLFLIGLFFSMVLFVVGMIGGLFMLARTQFSTSASDAPSSPEEKDEVASGPVSDSKTIEGEYRVLESQDLPERRDSY